MHGSTFSMHREQRPRPLLLRVGAFYGVLFALAFALCSWGYDAWILRVNSAAAPWTKLALGLPPALLIGGVTGWLAVFLSAPLVSTVLWGIAGGALGLLIGHLPFEGQTLLAWVVESRFQGVEIFPFAYAARVRTLIVTLIMSFFGLGVGLLETQVVEGAWDRATGGKLGLGSWLTLLMVVPLALPFALVADNFVHRPLRGPQVSVGTLMEYVVAGAKEEALAKGVDYRAAERFRDAFTPEYCVHFVDFEGSTASMYAAYVDVVFENGFMLRCATAGPRVVYCDDLGRRLQTWVADLVHAGRSGERRWAAPEAAERLKVGEDVVRWLERRRDRLDGGYVAEPVARCGDVILMGVRFDSGFEMTCRFSGSGRVQVDRCWETVSAAEE
ncbi:MAG: hypothetical protein ACP5HM_01255 [Anaerolineae bacterium]